MLSFPNRNVTNDGSACGFMVANRKDKRSAILCHVDCSLRLFLNG